MAPEKRRAENELNVSDTRKSKKQWQMPRKNEHDQNRIQLEPGMTGIWVTCDMGKERQCEREVMDLLDEYASKLNIIPHGSNTTELDTDKADPDRGTEADIEADIQRELHDIRDSKTQSSFSPIRIDTQCLTFFQTHAPIAPVTLIEQICQDALRSPRRKRSRFVKRLTPMTLLGKATESGVGEVAKHVLEPHFHQVDGAPKKFAIRINIRNHNTLKRDSVIKQVAAAVGPKHTVDLKGYDLLVIVEIYRTICGMSVVGNEFEKFKRFNLAELYQPASGGDATHTEHESERS